MATPKLGTQLAELATVVDALVARVAALEAARPHRRAPADLDDVQTMLADLPATGGGTVRYAGAVAVADRVVAWQMDRPRDELATADSAGVAPALAALGSTQRVQIVQLLLRAPASTAELTARLDGRSSGQLFHHLKELLAADVIFQPARGMYAIRDANVVPLLTLLSCALDMGGALDEFAP